jgi:hypothetical protein
MNAGQVKQLLDANKNEAVYSERLHKPLGGDVFICLSSLKERGTYDPTYWLIRNMLQK